MHIYNAKSSLNGCYVIPWVRYKGRQGDFYFLGSNCIWMLPGITSGDFFNCNLRPSFLVCFVSLLCS
ncbi:hypothetical protein HanPI659440_Chr06g0219371 [Helianthus annuus]|nr:hypothetical protein HanPI659440_Chr06g0219371 [Helianthus annuus]